MKAPRYLSLFTGAGGVDLGLDAAGWECIGQCEIDDTARSVLARHWPDVHRWNDVRDVANPLSAGVEQPQWIDARDDFCGVDLIVGGFPCQDVSVAGRRAGLAGERSGLWWEFHRIVESVRPGAVLVENVEGLLSSNGGRDLGSVVDALVELGYGVAWRVLDAQHFGVPQRRRRVFLLALAGGRVGAERAAEVLALTAGSGGDHPPRGEAREGTPGAAGRGPVGPLTTRTGALRGDSLDGAHYVETVSALGTSRGGGHGLNAEKAAGGQLIVSTLQAPKGRGWRVDAEGAAGGQLVPMGATFTGNDWTALEGMSPTIRAGADRQNTAPMVADAAVRRLTPKECERLMGWPDDHTRYDATGREIADARRYAMCGNGVVAPVAEWIGARLARELAREDNEIAPAA